MATKIEPMKTRNKSNQERRNSVTEITEYFNNVSDTPSTSSTPIKSKVKDKEKTKGAKQTEFKDTKALKMPIKDKDKEIENAGQPETVVSESSANESNCNQHDQENVAVLSKQSQQTEAATQTDEDAIFQLIHDLQTRVNKVEDDIHLPKNGIAEQLAKTSAKVQDLYSDIHGQVDGLLVKLSSITVIAENNTKKLEQMESTQKRMSAMIADNKKLLHELQLMKGLVQKISQQSTATSNQVLDLTKRGMEQNIIVHGIDDKIEVDDAKEKNPMFLPRERCKHSALRFFKEEMKVDLDPDDIWKAHRTGPYKQGKVRPVILKLSYTAKELIMDNLSELKGKKNHKTDQVYFIAEQIPEGIVERKKQTSARVKTLKELNEKKPDSQKQKISVVQDKVLIDGELDLPLVQTPQPEQLFPDSATQSRIDIIQTKMLETQPSRVKSSEFVAMAVKVHTLQEVNDAYIAAIQRFPSADHVMAAYAFREKGKVYHGNCDDREYGGSVKIKNCIFEMQAKNTAVFVARKFGGLHIGFDRFRSIENVSREALTLLENSV